MGNKNTIQPRPLKIDYHLQRKPKLKLRAPETDSSLLTGHISESSLDISGDYTYDNDVVPSYYCPIGHEIPYIVENFTHDYNKKERLYCGECDRSYSLRYLSQKKP